MAVMHSALIFAAILALGLGNECPKCEVDSCPKEAAQCPYGLVTDMCGCCPKGVCGLGEGDKCYNKTLSLPSEAKKYGLCGESLRCLMRPDLTSKDEPEAMCVCQELQPACGSDNRTYDSVCQLNKEAAKRGFSDELYLKHWGPCLSVPWIISGPQNVAGPLHAGLALDCEVKGYPAPAVHWEFKGDDGSFKILPSDDLYLAVQVRGGPEPFMATSWVQIVDLRPSDTGVYTCVATNSQGVARASANVGIRG
ncbi:insulin-like growth factor-binding protein-related protein 1 [Anabrus simplex]|uniref:insulin-like growth factor-binding protein-related protein 1 n=1 Tax=Anabrus simplex TaxID=316456 RepID=UPI0035A2833D